MSEPITKGAALTLEITDLNNLGYGVGRAPDGRAVFVAGTVAGDTVSAEVIKLNAKYLVARSLRILTPSPDREEGFCQAPASCGGCVYRNLTYKRELELKQNYVKHAFLKAGLSDVAVEEVRSTGITAAYRNKAEYPIANGKHGLYGGFYAPKSHRVVPAACCALQPAVFGEILQFFCEFYTEKKIAAYDEESGKGLLRHLYLRMAKATGEIMVCPVLNGSDLPHAAEFVGKLIAKFEGIQSFTKIEPASTAASTQENSVGAGERSFSTEPLASSKPMIKIMAETANPARYSNRA